MMNRWCKWCIVHSNNELMVQMVYSSVSICGALCRAVSMSNRHDVDSPQCALATFCSQSDLCGALYPANEHERILPNLASREAIDPPGTYSKKIFSVSSVFSVPCAHTVNAEHSQSLFQSCVSPVNKIAYMPATTCYAHTHPVNAEQIQRLFQQCVSPVNTIANMSAATCYACMQVLILLYSVQAAHSKQCIRQALASTE